MCEIVKRRQRASAYSKRYVGLWARIIFTERSSQCCERVWRLAWAATYIPSAVTAIRSRHAGSIRIV